MSWWLTHVSRATSEQSGLAELMESEAWLSDVSWRIGEDLQLITSFDIHHNGEAYSLFMAYPSTFPDTPPMVKPQSDIRLSGHQYGEGGELCLEYRPDNWSPTITGAMMVESAYRLLSGERPEGDADGIVRSAHQDLIGRDFRSEHRRFLMEATALEGLTQLPEDFPVPITAWDRIVQPTWVANLQSIGSEGSLWSQVGSIPSSAQILNGFVFRTSRTVDHFKVNPDQFVERMIDDFPEIVEALSETPFSGFILLGDSDKWVVLNLFAHDGKQLVCGYKPIIIPPAGIRLPAAHTSLSQKRVAIIGCGSVGSKIATMLARSGVNKFILVDHDIFFEANLVRNDLDARAIGQHKVDSLNARLRDILVDQEISCRRVALGQQESAGTTESVMQEIAQADLVVDATADPRAFNLVAAVSRRKQIPMLWCEVLAGGVGGIVARSRPNLDPTPEIARDQIQAWCDSQGVPWESSMETTYEAQRDQEPPLIADDADVTSIASHACRMALDILVGEDSKFPSSAYVIGLTAEWIFRAPFDTWPVELQFGGEWGESSETASKEDIANFLNALSPRPSS